MFNTIALRVSFLWTWARPAHPLLRNDGINFRPKAKQPINNGNPVLLPLFVCNLKQWILSWRRTR